MFYKEYCFDELESRLLQLENMISKINIFEYCFVILYEIKEKITFLPCFFCHVEPKCFSNVYFLACNEKYRSFALRKQRIY